MKPFFLVVRSSSSRVSSSARIFGSGHALGPSLSASSGFGWVSMKRPDTPTATAARASTGMNSRRSEEHTSELQSLMRSSYAVFCLKKTKNEQRVEDDVHTHDDVL